MKMVNSLQFWWKGSETYEIAKCPVTAEISDYLPTRDTLASLKGTLNLITVMGTHLLSLLFKTSLTWHSSPPNDGLERQNVWHFHFCLWHTARTESWLHLLPLLLFRQECVCERDIHLSISTSISIYLWTTHRCCIKNVWHCLILSQTIGWSSPRLSRAWSSLAVLASDWRC